MKRSVFVLALLLYALPAFADCIVAPVIGDGTDKNPRSPSIPVALAKLPNLKWTAYLPPKATTAIVCFPDSLKIPVGIPTITRDEAARQINALDSKIPVKPDALNLPAAKTSFENFLDRVLRLAGRYVGAAVAWATSSTDDFNRADNADLGAAWDVYTTPCQILSNAAHSDGGATNRCIEGYNTYIPTANQYVEITLAGNTPTSGDVSALVRLQAPTTYSTYLCRANFGEGGASSNIQRRDAGSLANLASESSTNWGSAPDVIRCEITNSAITFKRNGSTLLTTANDGTYTSGRGGIGIFDDLDFIDNFEVGDLPTSSRAPRKPIIYQ